MSAADRAIRVSTAAALLAVAGIAAYVSYWHAYEVIHAHGESGVTARLEPATIDGLVYASSMVIMYAARHRLAVPSLACWMLALGVLATLAANVAHGWADDPVGAVVTAWPAASLVGSYELLLWLVRTAADGVLVQDTDTDQMMVQVTEADPMSQPLAQGSDIAVVAPVNEMTKQEINGAAVAAYRETLKGQKPLSERKLAAMFGKTSRRWARSRMAEARRMDDGQDDREDGPPVDRQNQLERSGWRNQVVKRAASTR